MAEDNIQISDSAEGKTLTCPVYFDISVVAELHQSLSELLKEKPAAVILNAEFVEAIDTSVVQTLYAFKQAAQQQGIDVNWVNESEMVCQSATNLGMHDLLGLQCA